MNYLIFLLILIFFILIACFTLLKPSKKKCFLCENYYVEKNKNKTYFVCFSCKENILKENIFKEKIVEESEKTKEISIVSKNLIKDITINEKIWSNFVNENLLINCETEQEAKEFCLYCHKKGYKWYFDDKGDNQLINNSRWNIFKEKSFYSPYLTGIHCGSIDNIMEQYKNNIVKYKDIIKESELSKEINVHNKDEPKSNKITINKIHWNYFLNGNIAVNCEIKQEAKEFLDYCHSKGLKWVNGDPLIENNYWNVNKEKTSYRYDKKRNGLNYSDIMFYKNYKNLRITKYNIIKNKELKENEKC